MCEGSNFSTSSPTLVIVFFIIVILVGIKCCLIMVFICISLMANDVEHLFMCFCTGHLYTSLEKCCRAALHRPASLSSCRALRPNKEPGDSNRNISGSWDRGSYTNGPGGTPHCVWQTMGRNGSSLCYWGRRRLPFTGGIDIRWAHH